MDSLDCVVHKSVYQLSFYHYITNDSFKGNLCYSIVFYTSACTYISNREVMQPKCTLMANGECNYIINCT